MFGLKMGIFVSAGFICTAVLQFVCAEVQSISESDATALVRAQEMAKERAKDAKEAELLGAPILGTAIADSGPTKVILNRVESPQEVGEGSTEPLRVNLPFDESALFHSPMKDYKSLTLSGTVHDGITELWWQSEGYNFRIFVNADFRLLRDVADYENETTKYAVMSIITESGPYASFLDTEWRPTTEDFTSDQIEYFVVQSSGSAEVDAAAFEPIELMLVRYDRDYDELKVAFENAQKLSAARAAYLEANPPKERDTIINFAPINKATRD